MPRRRVVVTGAGVVSGPVTGASAALEAFLGDTAPWPPPEASGAGLVDNDKARRLSPVSRLAVAAARLATADAGLDPEAPLGLVLGTELGDLRSTIDFVDGFLARGPAGLSPLLFPSTVMSTMAAATAIALGARGRSLTLNAPRIAGELALARAWATIAGGRADRLLAGGVDDADARVMTVLGTLEPDGQIRREGAAFVVLEELERARARGARLLAEVKGMATGALPAPAGGVGRGVRSAVIARALEVAGLGAQDIGWAYVSAAGDARLDRWENAVLDAALATARTGLGAMLGRCSGLGALHVAAAGWTARAGLLPFGRHGETALAPARVSPGPGLVHGLARGGAHVALVVGTAA